VKRYFINHKTSARITVTGNPDKQRALDKHLRENGYVEVTREQYREHIVQNELVTYEHV